MTKPSFDIRNLIKRSDIVDDINKCFGDFVIDVNGVPYYKKEDVVDMIEHFLASVQGRFIVRGKVSYISKIYKRNEWNKRMLIIDYFTPNSNRGTYEPAIAPFEFTDKMYHWMNKTDDIQKGDIVSVVFRIDCRKWIKNGELQKDDHGNPKIFMSLNPIGVEIVEKRTEKQTEITDVLDEPIDDLPF